MAVLPQSIENLREFIVLDDHGKKETNSILDEIVLRYEEPWRSYHNIDHLSDMACFLLENVDDLQNPRATLWATLFHDGIYIAQSYPGANEEQSAQLLIDRLGSYLPEHELTLGAGYIRSTAGHECGGIDSDLALFLDADLKILGTDEERFEEFEAGIRKEYGFCDDEVYKQGRISVLTGFLMRERIFISDVAYDQLEEQARKNLDRKVTELRA